MIIQQRITQKRNKKKGAKRLKIVLRKLIISINNMDENFNNLNPVIAGLLLLGIAYGFLFSIVFLVTIGDLLCH